MDGLCSSLLLLHRYIYRLQETAPRNDRGPRRYRRLERRSLKADEGGAEHRGYLWNKYIAKI